MTKSRSSQKISTDQAPLAIGPYSQAISAGEFVFVSGQLPLDPATSQLIEKDIEAMTHRVIDNLEAILTAAGLSLEHVVKTEVYLKDLSDFPAMNRAYGSRFNHGIAPARQTLQVAKLPMDARIERNCLPLVLPL